jgi:N-acetylmuramoyl-L-alanine amidase
MVLTFIGLQVSTSGVYAQTLTVNSLRYWTQPTEARLVFDTTSTPAQDIVLLQNPARLVIDLKKAQLAKRLGQPASENRFFARFYTAYHSNNHLSIVVELKKTVKFKSFTLDPNDVYGHRLVIDVFDIDATVLASNALSKTAPIKAGMVKMLDASGERRFGSSREYDALPVKAKSSAYYGKAENALDATKKNDSAPLAVNDHLMKVSRKTASRNLAQASKEIIIAIDAGHGGKDSGAHGASGTEEKQVVYEIAKKLERLIAAQPGMTPVMVRTGDYFIKLRQRMQIARAAKADLFVSIHADAFKNSSAKGASVFTLSNRGASSEAARWLANNENAADLVGGVSLDDKDDMLASVLLDLSQTATTEASGNIARKVLANFRGINPLHKSAVQKAGFMVLKSPDIPSILVETAFISNPEEESKLRSDAHQSKVAKAIFNGIVGYFKQYVPIAAPTTRMAEAAPVDNG